MKYDELKNFISNQMRMEDGHNYQPVMILILNQNHGKESKEKIIEELQKYNPTFPKSHFNDCPVFDVLKKHNVVKFNSSTNEYELLDYDEIDTSFGRKAEITKLCTGKIENPFGTKLKQVNLEEIISEFLAWLQTEEAKKHLQTIENEKQEVKDIVKKIQSMEKTSSEFTDWVLYGLLPHFKTGRAKRESTFPVFYDVKALLLKQYNYSDSDFNKIANIIYDLIEKFQKDPNNLDKWIKEFTANKNYIRMIQAGVLSPILFCINDSFPLVNNRVRRTYKEFSSHFGWDDKMSRKMEDYLDTIEKCKKLIKQLNVEELKDLANFDVFCYWYDYIIEKELEEVEEDETEVIRKNIHDVNISEFLQVVKLDEKKKYEPHSLPNPERIKIRDIIQHCEKGRWQLPNFQRYFDWKDKDVKGLLRSIFRDHYIGSFLLWSIDREPPLPINPILGANPPEGSRAYSIILDGQQRMTSLFYAIKAPGVPTPRIPKPVYFYINFGAFFNEADATKDIIEEFDRKLSEEECFKGWLFPFYELEHIDSWIDKFEDFIGTTEDPTKFKQIKRYMERKLKHFYDGFDVPYISLPETIGMPDVVEIFEEINTSGKTLSVFDLLIATLSTFEIGLKDLWNDAVKNFEKIKSYKRIDKLPIYILQAISLFYHKNSLCSKEDTLKIHQNIFESSDLIFDDVWDDIANYVNEAIKKLENLRDGFGVKDRKALPYAPTIPILAALMKEIDSRPNRVECNNRLDMWYWSSVFGESYSGAVDSQLTVDFREMKQWFSDEEKIPKTVERFRREYATTINLREIESKSNATYRGILALVALEGAIDFNTNLALENAPENDKHHIFPKARFRNPRINSILNFTWLSGETNKKIKDKRPSIYIPEFIKDKFDGDEEKFRKVLNSHFINENAYEHMLNDDFESFIREREQTLLSKIATAIGIKKESQTQTMISPETPFDNEMLIENTITKCNDYIHWVDKFFRTKGLKWLRNYLPKDKIKTVKLLTSVDTVTEELRDLFKKFKEQMSHDGISCELRVITDSKLKGQIHGRWLITKNDCFSFQSVDTVSRGSYDEIRGGASRPPFDEWYKNSFDIITDWNKIQELSKK